MEIITDKRIELMTVVQTLCNYWENLAINFTNNRLYQSKYKENIKEYFEKYEGHDIIKLYKVLSNDVTDISAFINLALCYSNPPELNNVADYEFNFGKISASTFPFEEYINRLRQFYTDTEFVKFYEMNKDEYTNMINDYSEKSELSENTVFDYLDRKIENYNIIISPLVMGSFGIKVKTERNETLHYSVISPYDYKGNKYIFGPIESKKEYLWHEICHLTINDLTRKYINQFNVEKKQIPEIFAKNFYTTVEAIINEYIIRSITIRLFEMNGENEYAKYLIRDNIQKGFKNIESVKKYINEFYEENNKFVKDDSYKSLIEYIITEIMII